MSELALKLIAENKAKHARGEDARVLDLGHCRLTDVPKQVEELLWLHKLILSNNNITKIEIFKLPNLKILEMAHCRKVTNWDALENLLNLEEISIHHCGLKSVDFLSKLYSLKKITISYNNIDDVKKLKSLNDLEWLNIEHNKIDSFSKIPFLKNLIFLDVSFNKILSIKGIEQLPSLKTLSLRNTEISDIGELKYLTGLNRLSIRHNKINDFSPLIGILHKGVPVFKELDDGVDLFTPAIFHNFNPWTIPPIEILNQGTPAILRYFEDLEKSGTDQIHEAKLLLIGEGGAGKTTLCRKLFDPNAELPQEKDRTKGIDIHPLYFDIPGKPDKQFRLNIWDFAGQGKYQSAHSFFYTHRSLYVLVDDTRTLNENDAYRTLYNNWLQTAELFGGKSPVLVLHNEKDGCARTGFSLGGFQEHFGFVHGELFRINLGGGDTAKIEDLRRQIERQALALPHIGDTVPKTWVKVRDAIEIERQAHPYISAERYRALCEAEGITDPERQSDLSHYFHDLGVFLHFQDNPLLKRDVFLQNQWVTDAVYKILDDAQIAGEQRGRFTPADLKRLWHESTYRERRDELLALMLQFELCYQVQYTDTYICPQLLPGEHSISDFGISDFGTVTLEGSDFGGEVLQLRYLYVFMPKGLLYRLIVRLHRHIAQGQTAVWNAGVVLERAGAKAEITESLDRRTIFVRAVGLRAKELVTIINEELERLHAPFGERLKVTVRIPCNCGSCKGSQTPHFYDKIDLDTRLMKGKATVECSVSYDDVPVKGLLDGVFVKNVPHQANDKLKLFISYSKHDKDYLTTAKKHLKLFERQGKLRIWDDTQLNPGEVWDAAIKRELAAADIILFLVSADLIATDYVWEVEMKEALARAQEGEVSVVPVIVRACAWESAPFGKYNALPAKGKPIASYEDGDGAWKEVVNKIETLLTI